MEMDNRGSDKSEEGFWKNPLPSPPLPEAFLSIPEVSKAAR